MGFPITLGRYEIVRPLAEGGFGQVYLGRALGEAGFHRTVAIKRIRPELTASPEFVQDFIKEARIGGYLQHHNVVQVLGFERLGGHYALIMDFVDGVGLERVVSLLRERGEAMPLGVVAEICIQAADGLDYVHHLAGPDGQPLGLVHRDLKPSNLLMTTTGTVKVTDFGIARAAAQLGQQRTQAGMIKGTMAYFSPEQARGEPMDHRSDLYSLGAILYELLALEGLFPDREPFVVLGKVGRNDVGVRLDALPASAAPFLPLLRELLTTNPGDRIGSAAELGSRLRALLRSLDVPDQGLQRIAGVWCRELRNRADEPTDQTALIEANQSDPWLLGGRLPPIDEARTWVGYDESATPRGTKERLDDGGYGHRQTVAATHLPSVAGRPPENLSPPSVITPAVEQLSRTELHVAPKPVEAPAGAATGWFAAGEASAGGGGGAASGVQSASAAESPAPRSKTKPLMFIGPAVAIVVSLVTVFISTRDSGEDDAPAPAPAAQASSQAPAVAPVGQAPPPVAAPPVGAPPEEAATPTYARPQGVTKVANRPTAKAAPAPTPAPTPKPAPPTPKPAPPPTPKPQVVVAKPPPPPVAAPGKLVVSSLPSSRVFVEGKDYGDTPVSRSDLPPGTYKVRLSRPDLQFQQNVEVVVKSGATVRVVCHSGGCDVTYP